MIPKITVRPDGKLSFKLILDPEVYGMLIKYKSIKDTANIPVNDTINSILRDFLIDRLARPTGHATIRTLDKFDALDIEPGK